MARGDGMTRLPIFPLPVVLIPEMTLPLHIFEPRYRLLLRECLEGERLFGLSHHPEADVGVLAVPEPESIGCAARILHVAFLPDGRANILTVGTNRYRIGRYLSHDPYLLAEVEFFEDEPPDESEQEEILALVRRISARFARFLRAVQILHDRPPQPLALPTEPERLSFLVASTVFTQPQDLLRALEMVSTIARLTWAHRRLDDLVQEYEPRARSHLKAKRNGRKDLPSHID